MFYGPPIPKKLRETAIGAWHGHARVIAALGEQPCTCKGDNRAAASEHCPQHGEAISWHDEAQSLAEQENDRLCRLLQKHREWERHCDENHKLREECDRLRKDSATDTATVADAEAYRELCAAYREFRRTEPTLDRLLKAVQHDPYRESQRRDSLGDLATKLDDLRCSRDEWRERAESAERKLARRKA